MSYKTEITVNDGGPVESETPFGTLVQNISTREIGYICEIHHEIIFSGSDHPDKYVMGFDDSTLYNYDPNHWVPYIGSVTIETTKE